MIWVRVVSIKQGMEAIILALNEAEIRAEDRPEHTNQVQTATKHLKDTGEKNTVMVNSGHINKTTTLFITKEEEWRQATS